MPNQRRVLTHLSEAESLRRLGSVSLGRIVFTSKALPAIRPVNHIVHNGDVIIRSHGGAEIVTYARDGGVVAYEADVIDPDDHLGWSVIVTGRAVLVTDPDEVAQYQSMLRPWLSEPMMEHVIRIRPELVTGFELVPAPEAEPSPDVEPSPAVEPSAVASPAT